MALILLLLAAVVATVAQPIAIGGLLAFNSTIGRAAKASLELAIRDVNNGSIDGAPFVGTSTQLVLHLGNTNCSAFQGAAAGNLAQILTPRSMRVPGVLK